MIGLEDPAKPTILGQHNTTGFSLYLHLYNDETVLGLGREIIKYNVQSGLKLTMFNVSNANNPTPSA